MTSVSAIDPAEPDPPQDAPPHAASPMPFKELVTPLHPHTTDILENVSDAFVALDRDWRILHANREACRINQKPLTEFLGRVHWEEWPAAIGTDLERQLRRAMTERVAVHFEHRYVSTPYDVWLEVDVYPSKEGVNLFYRDVTARKSVEEELRRSREDLRLAVDGAQIGTFYCDFPLDKIVWNDTCKAHFFLPPDAEVDFALFYSLLHPDDREPTRRAIERAQAEHIAYDVEYRTLAPDGCTHWINAVGRFYYDAEGEPFRFDGISLDVSARKAAEEEMRRHTQRERFLADLAERVRGLTDPEAVIANAVNSVGLFLKASRCVLADIDIAADTCTVPPDYRADETVASMAGTFPISAFGPFLVGEYEAGRTVVAEDVRLDPVRFPADYAGAYAAVGIRAFVAVPVLHSSRLVSVIAAHNATARHWEPEDVQLLRTVVERTWLTVEVTRQQRALACEAQEQRLRAEREALLNRMGAAIRLARDPQTVLETAVRELGGALRADRCYYTAYDQEADTATVGPDWHREDLPPLAGQYRMSPFLVNRDPVYKAGRTQAVTDTAGDPATEALGLCALIRVPMVSGTSMTALSVAMADGPRRWTADEVSLVEAVATQTQSALESVRVQQREHRIATDLQDALQPSLPQQIAGLSVGKFTRPALNEAQIGGDFYDVFALDKNLYAVVIGDVSGKGLAAAQQIALVRNSLRTTLYLYRSPAQAATALNRIVTSHDLLVGFVTAWVGVYDALTGEIAYCSCGHEPGIVRRAGGGMEELATMGPPLGVAENAEYSEGAVTLLRGDEILLYTDGLSEAGPSRRELLGTDGLTRMLRALPVDQDVQAEAEALVAQVSEVAGSVFRDDVAVLLMRREYR